jgi:hypothetical protein
LIPYLQVNKKTFPRRVASRRRGYDEEKKTYVLKLADEDDGSSVEMPDPVDLPPSTLPPNPKLAEKGAQIPPTIIRVRRPETTVVPANQGTQHNFQQPLIPPRGPPKNVSRITKTGTPVVPANEGTQPEEQQAEEQQAGRPPRIPPEKRPRITRASQETTEVSEETTKASKGIRESPRRKRPNKRYT